MSAPPPLVICQTCCATFEPWDERRPSWARGCDGHVEFCEGVLSVVCRFGSRFRGEEWVVVGGLPEGWEEGMRVCDECVISLIERGAVRRSGG